jgi:hypothetical protein
MQSAGSANSAARALYNAASDSVADSRGDSGACIPRFASLRMEIAESPHEPWRLSKRLGGPGTLRLESEGRLVRNIQHKDLTFSWHHEPRAASPPNRQRLSRKGTSWS